MASPVTTKLNQLSSQYSAKVKRIRELEASKRSWFTDAEAKKVNDEINKLTADAKKDFDDLAKLQKLEKSAKDYTKIQDDLKKVQAQIDKAKARGESTTTLQAKKDTLTNKFNSIAPKVEEAFPDIKAKPAPEVKTGPMGNVQMTTGTAVTDTTASKAAAAKKAEEAKKKAGNLPAVAQDPLALAKKEAARTKKLGAASKEDVVTSDYAQRNAGMAAAPKTPTGTKTATGAEDINAIYTLARSKYGNVDSIFLYDPELKQLLIEAVGDPATAKDDMDADEFARRLGASDWAIRNSTTYAKRDAERRQYTETLDKYNQQLQLADTQEKKDAILSKIGQLNTTSSYARGLAAAKAYIEATASGLTGTMSPERLDAFVKKMYDSANDKDPNIINRELSALISYKPGSTLGGAIGGDLVTLRATAKANGFDLDKTFGDQINGWLQRLAKGESVETFKNVIRSQAKLGLPDKVSNLLDQGLDLANIYEPYKRLMANVLELAPDAIDLNDATLRSAIGADKEMSLYEFQRTLRKDSRWQYTDNARADVSSSVLQVLRDFGFQG